MFLLGVLMLAYLGSVSTPMEVSLEYVEYSDGTIVFRLFTLTPSRLYSIPLFIVVSAVRVTVIVG